MKPLTAAYANKVTLCNIVNKMMIPLYIITIQLPINFPHYEKSHISLLHFHPHLQQKLLLEKLGSREKCKEAVAQKGFIKVAVLKSVWKIHKKAV